MISINRDALFNDIFLFFLCKNNNIYVQKKRIVRMIKILRLIRLQKHAKKNFLDLKRDLLFSHLKIDYNYFNDKSLPFFT